MQTSVCTPTLHAPGYNEYHTYSYIYHTIYHIYPLNLSQSGSRWSSSLIYTILGTGLKRKYSLMQGFIF